jgi:predicted nucleic acid-binding protein
MRAVQGVLVDSSVLLDIVTADPQWGAWSSEALATWAEHVPLYINVVIYTEVSMGFARIEEVEAALPQDAFRRAPIPWEAGFLAGKAFVVYRQRGGTRTLPLPDFFIGAHAAVADLALLTRDPHRIRTYFPQVHLITPPAAP